jgi:hypothetical protein
MSAPDMTETRCGRTYPTRTGCVKPVAAQGGIGFLGGPHCRPPWSTGSLFLQCRIEFWENSTRTTTFRPRETTE